MLTNPNESAMGIKTKFSVGDKVWTIPSYTPTLKPIRFEIAAIRITSSSLIEYDSGSEVYHEEGRCFATKEEMIKYITDNGNENM